MDGTDQTTDDVLSRMLNTPPKLHKPGKESSPIKPPIVGKNKGNRRKGG